MPAPQLLLPTPKAPNRPLCGKRGDTTGVFTPNDVIAVFDFRVADTVHAQVLPKEPRRDFLHLERMVRRGEAKEAAPGSYQRTSRRG